MLANQLPPKTMKRKLDTTSIPTLKIDLHIEPLTLVSVRLKAYRLEIRLSTLDTVSLAFPNGIPTPTMPSRTSFLPIGCHFGFADASPNTMLDIAADAFSVSESKVAAS